MSITRAVFTALIAIVAVGAPAQAGKGKAWTDPETAAKEHPGFAIQGEYRSDKYGAQVIALPEGKFRVVTYHGGLPGAGWNGDRKSIGRHEGEFKDGQVIFENKQDKYVGIVKDGAVTIKSPKGQTLGTLKKIQRQSPTLGMKPPAGAVVLFDGTKASLNHWEQGAKMTDDGLLMQGAKSKKLFQDATIHVEFRIPFMPDARGQGRGNSGLYVQGRYETQMLDSFGLEGKQNETGGIYSVRAPDLNMCLPPLTWQTYDIEFTAARFDAAGKKTANARMTVKLNGVLVQDDVEVDHATTAARLKEGPEPGPIFLQNHGGDPVRYRNIWYVPKD